MKKTIPLVIAAFAFTLPQLASAVPLRATFDGNVSGSSGFFNTVLNDFPAGTAASFDVTFEDTAPSSVTAETLTHLGITNFRKEAHNDNLTRNP